MDKKEAKKVLEIFTKYRKGQLKSAEVLDPKEITEALEIAVKMLSDNK